VFQAFKGFDGCYHPACASFDMFDDFEQRGRVFKDCVNNWGV
jgi:UDP-N-acetylmuramoylalanine--D-glutamate ligase